MPGRRQSSSIQPPVMRTSRSASPTGPKVHCGRSSSSGSGGCCPRRKMRSHAPAAAGSCGSPADRSRPFAAPRGHRSTRRLEVRRALGALLLGNANLSLGDFREAERAYAAQLELYPDHSSARAGVIWSLLAAHRDDEARAQLHRFQEGPYDGDRCPVKLADLEYFLGEEANAAEHAREALAEPSERYWPRGFLPSTTLGAVLWPSDRATASEHLATSEDIDRERLHGGDEGYMPHVDLAAVAAIRGDIGAACDSLRAAVDAGWQSAALAACDPLFENVQSDDEFRSLL